MKKLFWSTPLEEIFGNEAELLEAFIRHEAKDYRGSRLPTEEDRERWVNEILHKIVSGIKEKAKEGFNRFTIHSYGNVGCQIRTLEIDGRKPWFNIRGPNIVTDLCTCGKLDHWGWVGTVESQNGQGPLEEGKTKGGGKQGPTKPRPKTPPPPQKPQRTPPFFPDYLEW